MDWKYKHFNQQAVFNAPYQSVLDAARAVVADSLGEIEDTTDGFVARGFGAWHAAIATFRVKPTPAGTQIMVELLVERAAGRYYMLVDIGGYYNGQIDKWFTGILQRLGSTPEQILVSKTTPNIKVQRGCFAGCLVFFVVGVALGLLAIPFNSILVPLTIAATVIGFLAGVGTFLYVIYPDAPASKFIRDRLPIKQSKK
jgi:hypothetical protein